MLRVFFILLGLFATLLSDAQSQSLKSDHSRPNVLFIMADDLSDILLSEDSAAVIAPHIKELARRGRVFERAYSQSSLCNPSRSSLLTGRRPEDLRIWTNDPHFRGVNPRIVTLPQYFKRSGYHTVGIGKIYHNWGHVLEGDPESWSEPQQYHWAVHSADWYVPGRPYEIHMDIKKDAAVQCVDVPDEVYLDGRIANAAVDKLKQLRETPFFLAVGFWKPHLPYNAPKKYWDLYDRERLPPVTHTEPVASVPDIAYVDSDEARSYTDVPAHGTPIPESKKKELRHGYFAAISYLDAQVGKVLDALKALGLADNTIVVFTSDHGYHAGEHGQFGKWTNFEQGARVPLIISSPTMDQRGVASRSLVELVDLYPTLISACKLPELPPSKLLAGTSLLPILSDPAATVKPVAITQIARPLGGQDKLQIVGSSIRDPAFRYNRWVDIESGEVVAEEFYDLSEDIHAVHNQIGSDKLKEEMEQLRARLLQALPVAQGGVSF